MPCLFCCILKLDGILSMKYLPLEKFDLYTELTSDEVFRRLRSVIDTDRRWLIFSNKKFVGDVERYYFRLWRLTWWSQNFRPIIYGKIQQKELGCSIQIRMRMPWFGFLFYSFIFGYLWLSIFMGSANLVVQKIQTGIWQIGSLGEWFQGIVLYLVMLSFVYFLPVGTFKWEAYRAINYLLKLTRTKRKNIIYRDQILGFTEIQIVRAIFLLPLGISIGWTIFELFQ